MKSQLQLSQSRSKSIRHQLSSIAWQRGMNAFFECNVPISFTNGRQMTAWVLRLAEAMGLGQDGVFRIKEYGAGLGVLAASVIRRLEAGSGAWRYTISEYSAQSIAQLQATILNAAPADRVTFCTEDVLRPSEALGSHSLIIINYLLDSLPTDHLIWQNGRLKEAKITTLIQADTPFLDTSGALPCFVLPEMVLSWFQEKSESDLVWLVPALSDRLSETTSVADCANLTQRERALLTDYLSQRQSEDLAFNFPLRLFDLLDRLWTELTDDGTVLAFEIADIGDTNIQDIHRLTVGFRGVVCYPVLIPLIQWYWENQKQGVCRHSDSQFGQEILIQLGKTAIPLDLSAEMNREWLGCDDVLNQELGLVSGSQPTWREALESMSRRIPDQTRNDAFWCLQLAIAADRLGDPELAQRYLLPVFDWYGDLVMPANLLMARCELALGLESACTDRLRRVLAIAPDTVLAHKLLMGLAAKRTDWPTFLYHARQSIQYGSQQSPWETLLSVALVTLQAGDRQGAIEMIQHLKTQMGINPGAFSIDFSDRVQKAVSVIIPNP